MNQVSDEDDYVDWGCGFPEVLARVGVVPYGKKDTIPLVPYHIVETQVRQEMGSQAG